MTKEQFITLLRKPATINLNMVKGLEEITERFPYFQNAHLLLAKQYQGHQNIRYESYLRKAAAYASDRSVLYDLIKLEPEEVIHMEKTADPAEQKTVELLNSIPSSEKNENSIADEQVYDVNNISEQNNSNELLETPTGRNDQDNLNTTIDSSEREATVELNSQVEQIVDNSAPVTDENKSFEPVESIKEKSHLVEIVSEQILFNNENKTIEIKETVSDKPLVVINDFDDDQVNKENELLKSTKVDSDVSETVDTNSAEAKKVGEEYLLAPEQIVEATDILSTEANEIGEYKSLAPEQIVEEELHDDATAEIEKNNDSENAVSTDPQEIIAKRLRELAMKKEHKESALSYEANPIIESLPDVVSPAEIENVEDTESPEEPEFVRVRGEQREVKTFAEPIVRAVEPKIEDEQHTFLDWLKIKDIPVLPAGNNTEYFKKDMEADVSLNKPGDQLINQFIKTEPRIVPFKSEFYSPGNMARQSATDHDDLISETLARIYAQQGNIPKAIEAYNRLSLKMPEKSAYFAALIKELNDNSAS